MTNEAISPLAQRRQQLVDRSRMLAATTALEIARTNDLLAEISATIAGSAGVVDRSRRMLDSLDASRRELPRPGSNPDERPGCAIGNRPARPAETDPLVGIRPRQGSRGCTPAAAIYTGFFWADRRHSIEFHFTSHDLIEAITIAYGFLMNSDIPEPSYKAFLLDRLQSWDGQAVHMTTLQTGKLVIFSGPPGVGVSDILVSPEDLPARHRSR